MKRLLLLLAACSHAESTPAKNNLFDTIAIHVPPGISDLTLDDKGHLWAIAERDRVASEMTPDGTPIADHVVAIPTGIDTEALAFLGDGRFAIGTEGTDEPTASIVFVKLDDHGALQITSTRELTNADLGVTLTKNHGVEAVCGHGDEVLAAIETVGKDDHGRYAPLVHLRGEQMTVGKLRLTSDVGKISALACTWKPDGSVDLRAVERHYKVSRILHGTLPANATEIAPSVEIDLEPVLHDSLNVEGLVVLPDGHLEAVNDNQGSKVSGPTVLMRFK